MIFKKLTLKNFMSYSKAEIDFSGIHVACLVGPNGAGKSTILDAISWAIWEEGRARTDDLIKLNHNEMSCEVEFFMEDSLYRVYRSRVKAFKNAQGKSNLEFQLFNPKTKEWNLLTLSSVRQTQDFIVKTLKMDHGTFVNSVYLRQGQADEFTIKKPNDRKQILANILTLEIYDKLSSLARDKNKETEQAIALEERLIEDIKNKTLQEDALKEKVKEVNRELNKKTNQLNELKKIITLEEKALNEKKEKERQIQVLDTSRRSQASLIKTLEEHQENIKIKIDKCNQLLDSKNQIQQDYQEYLKLKEELNTLELDREKYNKLSEGKNALELELKDKIRQIEKGVAVYKSKVSDRNTLKVNLETRLKNENRFKDFFDSTKKEILAFSNLQDSLLKIEKEGLELKHNKDLLSMSISKLSERKSEIKTKINSLTTHKHQELCPLCKSLIKDKNKVIESYKLDLANLDKEEKTLQEGLEVLENAIHTKRKEYNSIKEKINGFKEVILKLLPQLQEIRQETIEIRDKEKLQTLQGTAAISFLESQLEITRAEFVKAKAQIILLDKEINDFNTEVISLNNLLSSGSVVKDISENLTKITDEINKLKYEPSKYDELRRQIKEKENIVIVQNSLIKAEDEILGLNRDHQVLTIKINSSQSELIKLEELIVLNKKEIVDISIKEKELEELKNKELGETNTLYEIKKQLIIYEQALQEIEELKEVVKSKEANIKTHISNKKQYEILEKAFSKNGIQAAIIETVVPEIEKEANRILSKLTENQMHIALKTQREKRSQDGFVETLDVIIADNIGTRNYELYSGGEAFKIDFALRLALSQLLANRAGAKLQTLIIDEGFGSQDTNGKERLIEVIRSIQNEFELILVVTHIDELKEVFPVQIQVTKDEEGSKIKLVA